jgi:unsaturated chondroitin disaccharide hydrolase
MKWLFSTILILTLLSCSSTLDKNDEKVVDEIGEQLFVLIKLVRNQGILNKNDGIIFPKTLNNEGQIIYVGVDDWTSGFYPGMLWLMYDLTGSEIWEKEAAKYTDTLIMEQYNSFCSNLGLKMMCSFGNGYRICKNPEYKNILINSARLITTRFNEESEKIQSINYYKSGSDYQDVNEEMMSLDLLFFAYHETGDPVFYNIAVKHAETTMNNFLRSSFNHPQTNDTISDNTNLKTDFLVAQEDAYRAREQAFSLYGFVKVYQETKDPAFLKHSEEIANHVLTSSSFFNNSIPSSHLNTTENSILKDILATSVLVSALYKLSSEMVVHKDLYKSVADKIMLSLLDNNSLSKPGANSGFILMNLTSTDVSDYKADVPLIYANYFFLEGLKEKIKTNEKNINLITNINLKR